MRTTIYSLLLLATLYVVQSCSGTDPVDQLLDEQGQTLHQRGQGFYCELQALGRKSKVLWDVVAEDLEQGIPNDLPPDERKNMIAIRNAGLIRMFEAYPKLPEPVRDRVDQAEMEDKEIALQMRIMNDSLRQFELEVEQFLQTVKMQLPDSVENWQKRLIVYNCDE